MVNWPVLSLTTFLPLVGAAFIMMVRGRIPGGVSDLVLAYFYGTSWAGTDQGHVIHQLKLQLGVRGS